MPDVKECNECAYITITETEQLKRGIDVPHICRASGNRLYHREMKPEIPIPIDCPFSGRLTAIDANQRCELVKRWEIATKLYDELKVKREGQKEFNHEYECIWEAKGE